MFIKLPYKDLIFALRGYSSNFFILDETEYENNLDRKIFQDCFGESNLDNLKKLNSLAVDHKIILDYIELNQVTCCNYTKKFIDGLLDCLKEYYDHLNYLLDKKDYLITLSAFHILFQYEQFFKVLVSIIKQINSISSIKLHKILIEKIKSSDLNLCRLFNIIFFHYKNAFFTDLWNWLIYGYLDDHENKFFIEYSEYDDEIFKLKTNDLPLFDNLLIKRILMHGKLIYLFKLNYKISWEEIFTNTLDELSIEFMELCSTKQYLESQLIKFIKNVTDVLLKFYSCHLIEKQNIMSHLKLIKELHLMGNHSLWMNFCVDLVKKIESKKFNKDTDLTIKDVNGCLFKNIRDFYGDGDQLNQFQNQIQINDVKYCKIFETAKLFDKYKKFDYYSKIFFFPEISIIYNFPAMIRLFITKDTFNKYNILFNFLLKLHQTRMILNKLWFQNLKNLNYDKRICIITMKLTSFIEKLIFHYKVYIIEIAYCEFENEVKNYNDPSDLEQCHTKFIDRLLKESLIDIEGVYNQFLDFFAFCQKVYLINQNEITEKQIFDLQLEFNDFKSYFSLLFSSVKAHEISSSLKYLLN